MKGYCDKCGVVIDETDITTHECDTYWIDGWFIPWWSGKSNFSHDRQIFVPKHATLRIENNRIYIKAKFALAQIRIANNKYLDWSDKKDANLGLLVKALNKPWVKEPYVEPEPQFKVSLP